MLHALHETGRSFIFEANNSPTTQLECAFAAHLSCILVNSPPCARNWLPPLFKIGLMEYPAALLGGHSAHPPPPLWVRFLRGHISTHSLDKSKNCGGVVGLSRLSQAGVPILDIRRHQPALSGEVGLPNKIEQSLLSRLFKK